MPNSPARFNRVNDMPKYLHVPLYFLFVGSLLGVFLRWQFIAPTPGVNYTFFLHGHSHVMFLGWVFNALYIGFVSNHIPGRDHKFFIALFIILQMTVVAMMISFPLQGYGFYSILFSTLHTIGAIIFAIRFLIRTKTITTTAMWYARMALIFFVVSTAGPFSLGYLMANEVGNSNWSNLSIYFYLHFQYNGFFFFGILSLFFSLLEHKQIPFDVKKAKTAGWILAVVCVPAYLLSTLWTKPGQVVGITGLMAALAQCVGFVSLLRLLCEHATDLKERYTSPSLILLTVTFMALGVKFLLQVASAHPFVVQMAYELRPVVIGYLHLVLVGAISSFLLAWYLEQDFIHKTLTLPATGIFLFSFIGMECILVLYPWWSSIAGYVAFDAADWCFGFASLLSMSYFTFLVGSVIKKSW